MKLTPKFDFKYQVNFIFLHIVTMPGKRKAWSVKEKLAVVDRIRKGEARTKVCKELGLAESTLRGWLKEEVKLREFIYTVDDDDGMQRKRARTASDPGLDKAVFNWFVQEQQHGVPISGPIMKAQVCRLPKGIRFHCEFSFLICVH